MKAFSLLIGALALISASFAGTAGASAPDQQQVAVDEDNDANDGDTPNNVIDDDDNVHPSGNDRSVENGGSNNQGNAGSDPDGDANGGADKPGGQGGNDLADQDGNNGCGNDDDFEDDNNGRCLGRDGAPGQQPEVEPTCPTGEMPPADGELVDDESDGEADNCVPVEEEEETDKVSICHATGSETNPYVFITIAKQAVLGGHLDHQDLEDIIPAFGDFPGQPIGQGTVTDEDCPLRETDEDDELECPTGMVPPLEGELVDGADEDDLADNCDEVDRSDEDEELECPVGMVPPQEGELVDGADDDDLADICVRVNNDVVTPPTNPGNPGGGNPNPEVPAKNPVDTPAGENPTEVEGEGVVNPQPPIRPIPMVVAAPDSPAVLGDVVTRQVSGQLPRTGNDATGLAPFGLGLLLAGFALQRSSTRVRRNA